MDEKFILDNESYVDKNQACYQPNIAATRWLSIRLEMLGNLIILFSALFAVIGKGSIDAGLVGVTLTYSSQITTSLNFLIRQTSQVSKYIFYILRDPINSYLLALRLYKSLTRPRVL